MLDAWEAKNQNFCGILYKPLDAAPLTATSVCSIKPAGTPSQAENKHFLHLVKQSLGLCDVTTSSTALFYLVFQFQKLHA